MSSKLTHFQCATRDIALKRLRATIGPRRFLIADEVGLGKTVVAREILREMMNAEARKGRPLNVFYIANNLNVAAQNRGSLSRVQTDTKESPASRQSDRLSLLAVMPLSTRKQGLRLYSLTLDTSVPGLRGGNPLGKMEERAAVVALLDRLWPGFAASENTFNDSAKSWNSVLKQQRFALDQRRDGAAATRRFRETLREVFEVEPGKSIEGAVRTWVDTLPKERKRWSPFMERMRTVLALAALDRSDVRPDLVILDEFQKFPEILAVRPNEKVAKALKDRALRLLVDRLLGPADKGPAVLLLSATPYKMHPAQQRSSGDASARLYDDFYRIVEFLNGSRGAEEARLLARDFKAFERLLFDPVEDGRDRHIEVMRRKDRIEERLRQAMVRTERSDDPNYVLQVPSPPVEAPLQGDDLVVFDDCADRLRRAAEPKKTKTAKRRKPSRIGMAVPLWTSVPYPMQTLGKGYVAWNDARSVISRSRLGKVAEVREPKRTARSVAQALFHPKLRALVEKVIRPADMALPWMPPTLKWWRLGGAWQTPDSGKALPLTKTLLFSRFRIAPSVIAGLVSLEVEREAAPIDYAYRALPRSSRFRSGGSRSSPGVAAAFFPWPWLVAAIDPAKNADADIEHVLTEATQSLRRWLNGEGIKIRRSSKPPRPIWKLVTAMQRRVAGDDAADLFTQQGYIGRALGKKVLATELKSWRNAATAVEMPLTLSEVKEIARFALSAPGVVLGRAVQRHWPGCISEDNLGLVFKVAWSALRPYVGHRYFDHALAGKRSRRRRADDMTPLMRGVVAGNLEALLDEQLALWLRVGSLTGSKLLEELSTVLALQTGRMTVHSRASSRVNGKGTDSFVIRSHAALPFVDGSDRGSSRRPGRKIEGDVKGERLKRAFNSPFWPHMLTTTSMGQEGLDFHLWCKRVVHWDLPTNPVDLEQREGRISRYAGLSVRDVLAREKGPAALEAVARRPFDRASPWLELFATVDKESESKSTADNPGLTPWWVLPEASLMRVVLEMPMSEQTVRLERILDDVLYYRLALGQPNTKRFVEKARVLGSIEARRYVIDLSSLRSRSFK